MSVSRSYLFVGAGDDAALKSAAASSADAVILCLEDLIHPVQRPAARLWLRGAVESLRTKQVVVRVNGVDTPDFVPDIEAVVPLMVESVMVPMIRSRNEMIVADWLMGDVERRHGIAAKTGIFALIETSQAFVNLREIGASTDRVRRFGIGCGDLVTELGLRGTGDEAELGYFRSTVTTVSASCGLEPPVGPVWLNIEDHDGLVAATRRCIAHGIQAKFCLSADQAAIVNRQYRPTADEVEQARKYIRIYDEIRQGDAIGSVFVDGIFLDEPVIQRFHEILRRSGEDHATVV